MKQEFRQDSTPLRKKAMLESMEKHYGIVTYAARDAKIDRTTHYVWLKEDDEYRKSIESIEDVALDFVESKLLEKVEMGSDTAITFYMRCKARRRGYTERQEVDLNIQKPVRIIFGDENAE